MNMHDTSMTHYVFGPTEDNSNKSTVQVHSASIALESDLVWSHCADLTWSDSNTEASGSHLHWSGVPYCLKNSAALIAAAIEVGYRASHVKTMPNYAVTS